MAASKNPLDNPNPFTLVIFDYDGTLANSAPWFAGVLNEVARKYRFREVAPGELERLRGQDSVMLMRHLGVSRWKLPFIARHMRKLAARDRAQIKLFLGVDAALKSLHAAGFRLAIVSSNARTNVEAQLGHDLAGLIEHYACGASLFGKAKKFRQALEATAVTPDAALAIGDELRDIEAARQVGMASGAVAWGYADPATLEAQRPTLMFHNVEDIAAQLAPTPP